MSQKPSRLVRKKLFAFLEAVKEQGHYAQAKAHLRAAYWLTDEEAAQIIFEWNIKFRRRHHQEANRTGS